MIDLLVILCICLTASIFMSELFHRFRYPRVIGQILAGIILGIPFVKVFLFTETSLSYIHFLSEIGMIFLIMLVGLEVDIKQMRRSSRQAASVAFIAALFSFVLGFVLMMILGYQVVSAVIVGICLSISAEGVIIMILMEMEAIKTKTGNILIEAGIIDDMIGILLIAVVVTLVQGSADDILYMPVDLIIFIILVYLIFKIYPGFLWLVQKEVTQDLPLFLDIDPFMVKIIREEKSELPIFTVIIIFGLFMAALSQVLGIGSIIGAFIAGIIIQSSIKNVEVEQRLVEHFKLMVLGFVVPFFFIGVGLQFDINSLLNVSSILLVILIIIAATAGKVIGSQIAAIVSGLEKEVGTIIGWGMNARGSVELIAASIALNNQLIGAEIFSAIVAMAVVTTFISPAVFEHKFKKRFRYRIDDKFGK